MVAVSGAYLAQLLQDRGYPAPAVNVVRCYVDSLSQAAVADLAELVRGLSLATEATSDVIALIDKIRLHAQTEAPAVVPRTSMKSATPARAQRIDSSEINMLRQHGLHAYAKSGAVKMELDLLADDRAEAKRYTVRIDATTGTRGEYNWDRKIVFQLTLRELPTLAAFLLGYSGSRIFEATNHGRGGGKTLRLEDQGAHYFLRVSEPGSPVVAVPIAPAEVFGLAELVLTALAKNRPSVAPEAILILLRRVGAMT